MALLDPPDLALPSRWKEFSLDYKLFYVYEICLGVLGEFGHRLSVRQELLDAIVLAAIVVGISRRYRRRMNWRWPGVTPNGALNAAMAMLLAGAYEYAGTVFAPVSDPRFLPIHLLTLAIFAFLVLRALGIMQPSKSGFLRRCEAAPGMAAGMAEAAPAPSAGQRAVRIVYGLVYQFVWLDAAALLYFLGVALRNNSPKPTPALPDELVIVEMYVAHGVKVRLEVLLAVCVTGFALLALAGLVLHFFLGVRLFPDLPTYRELRQPTPQP